MDGILCLIPAKGCSTRLPRKNILPLGGKPLISHTIEKAQKAGIFQTICVSTEDEEIKAISQEEGAEVPFMRPEKLAYDPATVVDVLLHALKFYSQQGKSFQQVCVLLPTAPFVTVSDIAAAMEKYTESNARSLLSVTETEFPPYNAWVMTGEQEAETMVHCFPSSPYRAMKSTECPKTYRSNGAILILDVPTLLEKKGYQSGKITPFIMPQIRSIDIDTELEYQFAKFLYEVNLDKNNGTFK
jgi:CMP-N-acetylneuraminic acid synthetase